MANGRLLLPLSPAAQNISSRLPQTSDPCGSVFTGNILHENQDQVPVRIDYQLNTKHSFFARYLAHRHQHDRPVRAFARRRPDGRAGSAPMTGRSR